MSNWNAVNKVNLDDSTNASVYITPTWTPAPNKLYIMDIISSGTFRTVLSFVDTTGIGNAGWILVDTTGAFNTSYNVTRYRAMKPSGLVAGTTQVTLSGAASRAQIIITEIDGDVDITGADGAGAIVQTKNGILASANTALSIALNNASNPNNGVLAVCANNLSVDNGITENASRGFTELSDRHVQVIASEAQETETAFANIANQTADWTFASAVAGGITTEIKSGAAALAPNINTGPGIVVGSGKGFIGEGAIGVKDFMPASQGYGLVIGSPNSYVGQGAIGAPSPFGAAPSLGLVVGDPTAFVGEGTIGTPVQPVVSGSVAESVSITDAPSVLVVFLAAEVEAATAIDMPAATANFQAGLSVTEAVTPIDLPVASKVTISDIIESATPVDTLVAARITISDIIEAASIIDSPSASVVYAASAAESASIIDAPAAVIITTVSIVEAAGILDAPAATGLFAVNVSEAVAILETEVAGLALVVSVSESVGVQDTTDRTIATAASVLESGLLVDAPAATSFVVASITESAVALDLPAATIFAAVAVLETVAITDASDGATQGQISGSVIESTTPIDLPAATAVMLAAIAESAAANDVLDAVKITSGAVIEAAASIDVSDRAIITTADRKEAVAIAEATDAVVTQGQVFNVSTSEGASVTDSSDAIIVSGAAVFPLDAAAWGVGIKYGRRAKFKVALITPQRVKVLARAKVSYPIRKTTAALSIAVNFETKAIASMQFRKVINSFDLKSRMAHRSLAFAKSYDPDLHDFLLTLEAA